MRRRAALAALAALALSGLAPRGLAAAEPARVGFTTPPAGPGIPELVWIAGIEGAPADSVLGRAFDRGFRLAFEAGSLPTERRARDGRWQAWIRLTNRFHQLFGTTGSGAWQFQAALAPVAPARRAASPPLPAMDVTLVIHSPAMIEANARPLPTRARLVPDTTIAVATDYARALGAAVARLGLEHMHRLIEALPESERLAIDGFARETPPAPSGEEPGRR